MFEVTMLPANEGDCLLIRYGDPDAPHRVLIDAGRKATFAELLDLLPEDERALELFVITHVDRDHIEGALEVLGRQDAGFSFQDVWFNGYQHLDWQGDLEVFGAAQGEKVTKLLRKHDLPWNKAFGGGPVRLEDGAPVVRTLPGGLRITLLSPGAEQLLALKPQWEAECLKAGLAVDSQPDPEPPEAPAIDGALEAFGGTLEDLADTATSDDTAAPNGSSIAFLAEYDGQCAFFGADAHPVVLIKSLRALGRPLPLACGLVKAPHHGSKANLSRALLEVLTSEHFFISTSGAYFNHPDKVAIARIVTSATPGAKTLHFNYRQDQTRLWDESQSWMRQYRYRCAFPASDDEALVLELSGPGEIPGRRSTPPVHGGRGAP